jgi:hypothetical protein
MSDHLSDEELNRYRSRMMTPGDLLAANDHLAVCDRCYARFGGDYLQAAYDLARSSLRPGSENAVMTERELERAAPIKSPGVLVGIVAAIRRQLNQRFIQAAATVIITAGVTGALATLSMRNEPDQSGGKIEERREAMDRMEVELSQLREQNAALERELKSSRDEVSGLQSRISAGANLAVGAVTRPASRVVLSLNDGAGVVTMDSSGRLAGLKSLSQSHERLVKTVLATGRVKTPSLMARLMTRRGTLMGADRAVDGFLQLSRIASRYPLLSPVGTAVAGERPTFRWRALEGATSYVVSVYDAKMNEVVASQPLQQTEWTTTRPLDRGGIYTWQVRAARDGAEIRLPTPDLPNAKFMVIGTSTAREVESARGAYGSSPLVLGILYANAGLLDDAERELEAVGRANSQSLLAGQLLNSLRAAREK